MNRKIIIAKWVAVIVYALAVIALYSNFENIGYSVFEVVAYLFLFNVLIGTWFVMVYVFATSYFAKLMIQKKIDNASCYIGSISNVTLKSYKRSLTGDYVTMRFCSVGVPIENWESKLAEFQSVINYTIIGDIENYKNHLDVVIFDARKGRAKENDEVLYDDGF